ncbi:MAG TPA: xylulokinase [Armatimonadota bacterium]|nr:xylulokinase [Armatimonadota bacterium]
MAYLLGIDVGTSGTKTLLIDESGKVVASATDTYPLSTPKPLWAEQEPEDWWKATVSTIGTVLEESGIDPADIRGIGLSGQMHGAVFLDERNQVLRPSILWCDQRTGTECEWITETIGKAKVVELTSNPVLTGFTAGKIIWLRNNEPENYAKTRKVLLPKDYIRFRLTGEFATEVSDASGTSLFNVTKRQWADGMLDGAGIPREWMPKAYESPEISGRITEETAGLTGLKAGTPVVGGGGDQAAGAVGTGVVETGIISSTVGTSGVVFAFVDKPVVDPGLRVHTFCHAVPGKWHVMGVMLSAGGSLRWYRDAFADVESAEARANQVDVYDILSAQAATVELGCEGLIFLPYLTGERTPYPDPNARGAFFGITLRHGKPHFVRAVLEGVAYGLRDSFEILNEMRVPIEQVRASGGGARSEVWRQIQADVTGREHVLINVDEGPAFGVALLAGVGTGVYPSVEKACRDTIKVISATKPDLVRKAQYDSYYGVYRSLYPALKEQCRRVSEIVTSG